MTKPVFDENGWCDNLDMMPIERGSVIDIWVKPIDPKDPRAPRRIANCWWCEPEAEWRSFDNPLLPLELAREFTITHWRHAPSPPKGGE